MIVVLATLAVAVAAMIGGATGFATSLLLTPALLLLGFNVVEVVVVNLTLTLLTRIATLWKLRSSVDRRAVGLLAGGGIPGAVLGAAIAAALDLTLLKELAGIMVIAAGCHMLIRRSVTGRRAPASVHFAAVGAVGGFLSTTISLNGPPVAILLRRTERSPTRFVADFAGYFVAVNFASLVVLAAHARVPWQLYWSVIPVLACAALVGNRIGAALHPRISAENFRVLVALLVIGSGVLTVLV